MNKLITTQEATALKKKYLTVYNPSNCIKNASVLKTLDNAINSKAPTIASIKRDVGYEFTEGLIMAWLVHLNKVLNLKRPMTDEAIELCATDIVKDFSSLKMSDLTFLFKRIYSGYYGEFYESISVPKVLTFFNDYFEERCKFAENESYSKHMDTKSDQTFNYSKNVRRIISGQSNHSK